MIDPPERADLKPGRLAAIMPVGPGPVEFERAIDTSHSLLAHEPATSWLLFVDDGITEHRDFQSALGPSGVDMRVIANPLPPRYTDPLSRISTAVLAGLVWAVQRTDADLIVKLDTDALVIAPFAGDVLDACRDRSIGLLGSYRQDCNGGVRSFAPLAVPARRAVHLLHPHQARHPVRGLRARALIGESRAKGYEWGEHALGCAMAMPRHAIELITADGGLDDPTVFCGTKLGDDPALGILVRRSGLRLAGWVHEDGGFGLGWRGLPDTPQGLATRGFSVIHSVKNDSCVSEAEIRQFFRDRRRSPMDD